MKGAVAIVVALVAVAAACTFTSPFDDPEGFLGPAPSVDGSVQPFDASFDDEEGDGAVDASSSTGDAKGDAADATNADVDAGRPCDATFCDDFDIGPLGMTWTQILRPSSAGTLELVDAGRSAPFALSATTHGGALAYRNVDLAKQLGGVKTASCAFAVNPVERPGRPAIFFFRGLTTASETWQAWIALASTETTLGLVVFSKDGGPPFEAIAPAKVAPLDQWSELVIATDLTKITLSVDGAPDVEVPVPKAITIAGAGISAHVGIQVIETTQEVVLFDDVVCTITQ